MAKNVKVISPTIQNGEKNKSWYEMVTEEEESEAGNQNQSQEIIPALTNTITADGTGGTGEGIESLPLTISSEFLDTMGEKVLADDENEEDWGDEDCGEEDEKQYMENLLNNDDLLGYDLLNKEHPIPDLTSGSSNPMEHAAAEEPVALEMVNTDDGKEPQIKNSDTIPATVEPASLPEGTTPIISTSLRPNPTPTKKKSKSQPPKIGFGVKNMVLQGRVSPKGKNKKKIGPKTKPSPLAQPKTAGPPQISIQHGDPCLLVAEETPNHSP
ncbi:hypothetical protein AALP_AA5G117100 [Arabis alpina]|uniref:Uncharacterized protein n=1 Tax=Arabis alpina TaxID=50452 RepID=A0A087GWH4_ARAAL|nr:hypothetical protein AALP_AA5G117100 [Arabis alpina]